MRCERLRFSSAVILAILAILVSASIFPGFSSPSGQNWNVEGGGFCSGNYTVFNNTVDLKLYAMNCDTGIVEQGPSGDIGAIVNNVIAGMNGGEIDLRGGFFSELTSITLSNSGCTGVGSFYCGGYTLRGSGIGGCIAYGISPYTCSANATQIVAKNTITNMIQGTANPSVTSPMILNEHVTSLALIANGKATNGINFAHTEGGANGILIDYVLLTTEFPQAANCAGGFTTGIIMDGSEDSWITHVTSFGMGPAPCTSGVSGTDIQWKVPSGNINIAETLLGGAVNVFGSAQQWAITGGVLSSIKLSGSADTAGRQDIVITGVYAANQQGVGRVQLNGFQIGSLHVSGGFWLVSAAIPMFVGSGTLSNWDLCGTTWLFVGTPVWTSGAPTVTKNNTCGSNHVASGTTPTGFPFTIDGNGNF